MDFQTPVFHQVQDSSSVTPANLGFFPTPSLSHNADLEVVLQVIHQECHAVPEAPHDRVALVGPEVLALHL